MIDRVTRTASALVRAVCAAADRLLAPGDGIAPGAAGSRARPVTAAPDSTAQGQEPA